MPQVKERPIDKTVTRRFDATIMRAPALEPQDKPEREWWQARTERTCRGCKRRYMPNARADRYCAECKAERVEAKPELHAVKPDRPRSYWLMDNVVVAHEKNCHRYKPLGDCTRDDCLAVADRQYGNAQGKIGYQRTWFLGEAEKFAGLAGLLKLRGKATVADLAPEEAFGVFPVGWGPGRSWTAAEGGMNGIEPLWGIQRYQVLCEGGPFDGRPITSAQRVEIDEARGAVGPDL